jgi:soluble lytic murein transglycosylase
MGFLFCTVAGGELGQRQAWDRSRSINLAAAALLLLAVLVLPVTDAERGLWPRLAESAAAVRALFGDPAAEQAVANRAALRKIEAVVAKYQTGLDAELHPRLARRIQSESRAHGLDPELVLAVISVESSFYNWSRSRAGAIGLMQLRPATGREVAQAVAIPWHGRSTLVDPELNVRLGTRYLATLQERFGDLETALTAYNHGPTRVAALLKNCERLPRGYADRVLRTYETLKILNHSQIGRSWDPDVPGRVALNLTTAGRG